MPREKWIIDNKEIIVYPNEDSPVGGSDHRVLEKESRSHAKNLRQAIERGEEPELSGISNATAKRYSSRIAELKGYRNLAHKESTRTGK